MLGGCTQLTRYFVVPAVSKTPKTVVEVCYVDPSHYSQFFGHLRPRRSLKIALQEAPSVTKEPLCTCRQASKVKALQVGRLADGGRILQEGAA